MSGEGVRMKNPRVVFWVISATFVMFVLVVVTPLIYEAYKLSSEASRCERVLKAIPQFAKLQVIPCNKKFKGLVVQGVVASDQDFDSLEKQLRSYSSLNFWLSINTGNGVREMYILKTEKPKKDGD